MKVRAFLAVDLDEGLRDHVSRVQDTLKSADAQVKFVEPENLHFTLKFFGDVGGGKLRRIEDAVRETLRNYEPFEISIRGAGVFPNPRYIRVVWLGVENPETFSDLQRNLDMEFVKMGFRPERDYVPHLTVGRVKGPRNRDKLAELIGELEDVEVGSMRVSEVSLKRSELTPAGPVYSDIEVFRL
ncbi:RNA 2',3'-cyclic phosphodiesterase [Methanothermobacter thermautotrophicus]|jgi:2'-5' RNA ligase|uniref:RNA 2',3'-cyclic phosphodiesterase n=1 Tax=Methanothermobacter thermautotrophicus TaxID=145262 RepID=A0A842YT71_METTF|nr:RNA 2',3'-cyclic phosphodiesterase [Methanothermobacter thermautotrophicus]MBE2900815.1 RNA 2',3'-cyclic phosphodiesterase [Methanothermobacter thermautotrophicus]MCQ8904388.1 RNA 2',3'-cyclic phosphodiesterase [Methanothermobacter sp.]